jgi:16S rRNA (guanine527-N7)-methyltransferase
MTSAAEEVREVCRQNGLALSDSQVAQLDVYVRLLLQRNQRLNLISRKDEANVWIAHILHSLSMLLVVQFDLRARILDIGTGGGLPGIPLRIALPESTVTMVDSVKKKNAALTEFIAELQLKRTVALCSRVEELKRRTEYQHHFDVAVSRAVAPLEDLIGWSLPLLMLPTARRRHMSQVGSKQINSDGSLIAYKGGDLSNELKKARRRWPHVLIEVVPLDFGGLEHKHLVEKQLVIARAEP